MFNYNKMEFFDENIIFKRHIYAYKFVCAE